MANNKKREQLRMADLKRTFMMCEPTNFGMSGPKPGEPPPNKFVAKGYAIYEANTEAFVTEAVAQWNKVKDTIQKEANVVLTDTLKNTDDEKHFAQVFTADASISMTINGQAVVFLSGFTNTGRQSEVQVHKDFLKKYSPNAIVKNSPFNIEGTGDNVYDAYRDVFWSGFTIDPNRQNASSGRSDLRSHQFLRAATETQVNSLQTNNGFFHIDTALSPLPTGHIIFYPGGVNKEYHNLFNKLAFEDYGLDPNEYLIKVSSKDAENFVCNSLYIGNKKVIVPKEASNALQDALGEVGYTVIPLSIENFRYDGGGFHCMTNPIFEPKIEGGYHKQGLPVEFQKPGVGF